MSTSRHSKIAYVAIRLRLPDGETALMLRAHEKWGDFSLLGGHVEQGEHDDWSLTARREVAEEAEPLEPQVHFDVARLPIGRTEWGLTPSRSADDQPTHYEVEWFALQFLDSPAELLGAIDANTFAYVGLSSIDQLERARLATVVDRLFEALGHDWERLPLAWPDPVDLDELEFRRLDEWPARRAARQAVTRYRTLSRH